MRTPLLWTRALVLAVVALGAGVVSHVAADGSLPHPVALAALLGLSTVLVAPLLRTRASAGRLVALVVGGQLATHAALSTLAGHAGTATTSATTSATGSAPAAPLRAAPDLAGTMGAAADASTRRTGSLIEQYQSATAGVAGGPAADPFSALSAFVDHQVAHLAAQGPTMVLAHTLGAVALGLWLAVGESALWSLVHLGLARLDVATRAHLVLGAALAAVRDTLAAGRVHLPAPVPRRVRLPGVLDDPSRRRGPPSLLPA
ncbi:hypothetical protein GGQ22_08340 [Nocardioides sp. zg-579]|uniref:Uncharacterized protein n=1 Tax=Nocardioides marmotae TaxID=2663857 RepID=A0A6I3JAP0_9ACTN|nr:hypothetical protein [Nocardioides marmotae]MCR6031456.1 hypothetical protein [Gordonia jinghuaiqii]MTB95095.1 hypothetical protein [Nocardioides marmotae]QKE02413.1 hypothetical protein HPC71_16065 [Nocardioides marmotae]